MVIFGLVVIFIRVIFCKKLFLLFGLSFVLVNLLIKYLMVFFLFLVVGKWFLNLFEDSIFNGLWILVFEILL